jgi:hypothetical protein
VHCSDDASEHFYMRQRRGQPNTTAGITADANVLAAAGLGRRTSQHTPNTNAIVVLAGTCAMQRMAPAQHVCTRARATEGVRALALHYPHVRQGRIVT